MRKNTNKAFTLVELIVVITILAILATVAFISLGGQTEKARNTTKKDAIGKLATAVENAMTNGVNVTAFAADASSDLTAGMIGGVDATTVNSAGDMNYSAVDVKEEDFKDDNSSYKFGYTTIKKGKYEVAGTLVEGSLATAYLVGTYQPRDYTAGAAIPLASTGTTITILPAHIKKLAYGDVITDGTSTGTVTSVSSDFETLTVSSAMVASVGLASATSSITNTAESLGLIESSNTGGTPVTHTSTNIPY